MSSEGMSIEKCEIVALSVSDSEPVSPSVESVSTLQKKPKKSKAKVKAAIATVIATHELSEAERLGNLSVDHPYLSVLYKRIRSHRKKLEKIKSLELAQQNEGKVPNAQQLDLMSNKATFEKLVVELEMLREQFIGVFSEELEQKKRQGANEVTGAADEQLGKEVKDTLDTEKVAVESKQEMEMIHANEEHVVEETEFAHVYELLKTLHVVNLHQALGKEVPMVLDFFSKVLLGKTRPPAELSYDENLMESFEEAKKYLMDSDKLFACETMYNGLKVFVNEMATSLLDKGKEGENEDVDKKHAKQPLDEDEKRESKEKLDIPVVPAEINTLPQISFFTESQLEADHEDNDKFGEGTGSRNVAVEVLEESVEQPCTSSEPQSKEQGEGQVESSLSCEFDSSSPLSFATVAAGGTSERTPSTSPSSGLSGNDKKARDNSLQKSARRRGQGRWREKGSSSSSNKTDGSPTEGNKPRYSRVPRPNDDSISGRGGKRNGSKEEKRPRFDRGLRKQGNLPQQATTTLIAPHA